MNIQEAARKAQEQGTAIHRPSLGRRCCVIPTNSTRGCLTVEGANHRSTGFRWQPTLDDLLADDWEAEDPAGGVLHGRIAVDDGDDGGDQPEGAAGSGQGENKGGGDQAGQEGGGEQPKEETGSEQGENKGGGDQPGQEGGGEQPKGNAPKSKPAVSGAKKK